jgi:GAF domain-containing protein
MNRIKTIIREISGLANDPGSNLETILNAIAEGVHDYFYQDERDFGTVMSYIVLYPHTPQQFRLPAVYPESYRDSLNQALEEAMKNNGNTPRGVAYEAYRSREIQNIGDVRASKYAHIYAPHHKSDLPDTRSHLSVPIIAYRRRPRPEHSYEKIGVISIETDRANAFSQTDEQIVELLADYSAGIVDNKRIALSLEALQNSTHELAGTLSLNTLDEICNRVAQMAVDVLKHLHQEVAFCHVALLEQVGSDRVLNFRATYGNSQILVQKVGDNRLNLDNPPETLQGKVGIIGRCVLTNKTINAGETREHEDYIELDAHVRSQLAIPIKLEDAVLGAISVEFFEAHAFDMNEQRILESLAGAAAIAIQNVRMRVALQEISEISSTYPDIIDVLKVVKDKITELVTFQHSQSVNVALGIVSKEGGVRYDYPLVSENLLPVLLRPNQGLSQHVIRTGKELYRGNVKYDHDYISSNENAVSAFLAPVIVGASKGDSGSVMAIISIQSPIENAFDEYTFQIVRLFAGQAAVAIRSHRLFRALRKLHEISSRTDPYKTTFVTPMLSEGDLLPDRTTLMVRALDEEETVNFSDLKTEVMKAVDDDGLLTHTQQFAALGKNQYLLSKASNETQLASMIFQIAEAIISFHDEVQFEAMLVTFIAEEKAVNANLYSFTDIEEEQFPKIQTEPLSKLNLVSHVIEQRQIITSDHIYELSLPEFRHYQSFIFVPMILDESSNGVLAIFSHRKDAFNADDEWMLQNIADRAAEAYSNFRRVRRLNEGVLALNEIDRQIIGTASIDEERKNPLEPIWAFIVDTAIKLSEANGGAMLLYHPENETLELVHKEGDYDNGELNQVYTLDEPDSLESLAARERRIVTHADLKASVFAAMKESSLIAVPLIADDREDNHDNRSDQLHLIGVLTVRSKWRNVFDNEKIDLLKALAGQAVVALRYSKLISRMGYLFNTNLTLSHLNSGEAAQLILDKALEFIAPKEGLRGIIYTLDIATATLNLRCSAGFDPDNENHRKWLDRMAFLGLDHQNGISEAANERRRYHIEDVQEKREFQNFYADMPEIRSICSVAIYGSRESINGHEGNPQVVRGVITLISSEPKAFATVDRRLLIFFANQVELAWLYINQKRRMEELATINQEWGQVISDEDDSRARWRKLNIWDKVERLIGAKNGLIKERHLGTGELLWADDHNVLPDFDDMTEDIETILDQTAPSDIHMQVVDTQKAINIPDVKHRRSDLILSDQTTTFHIQPARSQLTVPMIDKDSKVRGIISVESPIPFAFDANDMRFLQVLVNQAWSVIDSAQSQRNRWEAGVLPTFFSMLHDHKNTLTGLRGLLLSRPEITGDGGDASNRIQRYVKLVEETQFAFNQLRDQESMVSEIHPVSTILEQVRKQFVSVYPQFDTPELVSIESHHCEGICIQVDTRLQHIFRNLLYNAVQYGKPPIIIGVASNPETQMLSFWVEDRGLGIHDDILDKIYEPKFERNDEQGWGLGLWFTKLFVQSMGGIIEKPVPVNLKEQQGTRFRFWLPIANCNEV